MIRENTIKFNEYRNLRDLLNVTFAFTKQEFRPLFKAMLILVLPLLVLLGIVVGIFSAENMSVVTSQSDITDYGGMEYIQNLIIQYGLIIIIYYLSTSVISSVILGYVIEYINNGPQVPFENILAQVKLFIPRILLLNIVTILIISVGMIFFVLPGIFLYVAFALSPVVLVIEDASLGISLKRSMYFIKGYWWRTLGYTLVISLIYMLISSVFGLPAGILTILQSTGLISATPDSPAMLMISIITNIISTVSYLFLSLYVIFITFYYYSQYELKEARNIIKSVEEIASN